MVTIDKARCEFIRSQVREKFDTVRQDWIEQGLWILPHRVKWMLGQEEGRRNNRHIVDQTHALALRSYVAGFSEGNTSAGRPWFRGGLKDPDLAKFATNKAWLDKFTQQCLTHLSVSNFYDAAGQFYYDFGVFNTGGLYAEELPGQKLFFHSMTPGSYAILNDRFGSPHILVREFTMTVRALIDAYGRKKDGKTDWTNFSSNVRKMYEDGNYTQKVDVVSIVMPNADFDPERPIALLNKQWTVVTYEIGTTKGPYYGNANVSSSTFEPLDKNKFLQVKALKRKPFIVGRSYSSNNFEYGETGPTTMALGLVKSLNKKAISKDIALEKMLSPTLQGPASLRKSYITSAANHFIPLDPTSAAQGGVKVVDQISNAFPQLIQDVSDLRSMVDKLFYADFLLYLSKNPKTRTATETNAILNEQQIVIGPNLQSLNETFNKPLVDFVMDWTLDTDPEVGEVPDSLAGKFIQTEFISVFAQAQKAADLPAVERFTQMIMNVGQIDARILDKVNTDRLADLYEDRLFLPAGLNRDQADVDAKREQAQAMAEKQQAMNETLPAAAGAAKDMATAQSMIQQ